MKLIRFRRPPRHRTIVRLSNEGMTLLELLVVMVILGLLATLGSLQVMSYLDRAKSDTATLRIRELSVALDLFRMDVGRPPLSEEGLAALVKAPDNVQNWRGPYLKGKGLTIDPWVGHSFTRALAIMASMICQHSGPTV